ncbi:MAG: hydantoinase B/oxoprolinase family protein, partial [Rhodospirillales bacterium]|nr:hydantoinase B/oxoprolinase family protein [Rhodospirillales bacterium]
MASFSIEVIEAENPLEILEYGFVPDTGGAGRYRGGVSLARSWRMLAEEGVLQVRADRQTHRPWGLAGGGPGAAGRNLLARGTTAPPEWQSVPGKLTRTFRAGEVFRHELPGGGGYGPALERDLDAVQRDLADGFVTIAGAARDYGVVAHGAPPVIDVVATAALRAQRAAAVPP